MRAPLAASIAMLLGLAVHGGARADEHASHDGARHELFAGVGVPVPLSLHGHDPGLDDGLDIELLLQLDAVYRVTPGADGVLWLGARAGLSIGGVDDGVLSLWGTVASLGPEAGVHLALGRAWRLSIGAGPALTTTHFAIDDNLQRRTWALGVQGNTALSWAPAEWCALTLDVAILHTFEPTERETFFNRALGSSTLLQIGLGPTLRGRL